MDKIKNAEMGDPVGELVEKAMAIGHFPEEEKELIKWAEKEWYVEGWAEGAESVEQGMFIEELISVLENKNKDISDMNDSDLKLFAEDVLGDFISMGRENLAQTSDFAYSSYTNHAEFSRENGIDELPADVADMFYEWFDGELFGNFDEGYDEGAMAQIDFAEVIKAVREPD